MFNISTGPLVMKISEQTTDEIKNRILDQAFIRFGKFGFGKTTMAEIAKDCEMSAGNLYRYFEDKKDLGAGCAQRCMEQKKEILREVVRRPGLTAKKRLETYVMELLRFIHGEFSDQPLLYDLVTYISMERKDLVVRHIEEQQSLLAEIISEGNRNEEFDVPDVLQASKMCFAALTKFNAPHFMGMFPLEQLQLEAKGVVDLLIRGLEKR